jgi:hypothetical protein
MANDDAAPSARVRWARLRFQILGPLMAAPAEEGELKRRIDELAARAWRHPTTGESIRFSFKTIERWWYTARGVDDPLAALARKVPSHAGTHPSLGPRLVEAIAKQHHDHPRWSFQLHHDTLHDKPAIAVKQLSVSGSVEIIAKSVAHRAAYDWQYSTDQKTWTSLPPTLQAKTTVSGLTVATVYYFRFQPLIKTGEENWSQIVSLLVN